MLTRFSIALLTTGLITLAGCASGRGSLADQTSTPVPISNVASQDSQGNLSDEDTDGDVRLAAVTQPADLAATETPSIALTAAQTDSGVTLELLEQLALTHNPTLSVQAASAQEASAIRQQVGRSANPTFGYAANQLADVGTDQHTLFLKQEFVTGGKLGLNQDVMRQAVEVERWNYQAQAHRVMTDVRIRFYAALAAQKRLELIEEFRGVASHGVELAEQRVAALEAARTDVLQAKIQLNEVDVELQQAQFASQAAWKELAAVVGIPTMSPRRLSGELPAAAPLADWDQRFQHLLQASPELHAARAKVAQARANLSRQEVQAIPNLTANLGAGIDNGTNNGMINLELSAPLPVFNRNEGNISAAYAAYCRATHDVRRVELAIQSRLAQVARDYDSARVAVEKYHQDILPQAQETLDLSEQAYNAGEFAFLQVLIIRRTFYEANLRYVQALSDLATAQSQVDGLLLTGALDSMEGFQGDDSLRGQTFSQQ